MIIIPNDWLKAELRKLGYKRLLLGFSVHKEDYAKFRAECVILHPDYTQEQIDGWAAYCAYTHPNATPPQEPKDRAPKIILRERLIMAWAALATILAITLGLVRSCH